MLIWIVFCLMAFAVIIAVLWPLSRPAAPLPQADEADIAFYKGQLEEIERDRVRGMLMPEEAEAARAEAGRRLLQATRSEGGAGKASYSGNAALRRRRIVAVMALMLIPVSAFSAYLRYGAPDYRARSDEQSAHQQQLDQINQEIAKREQYLRANPDDGQSWDRIAFVYLRMGRLEDAVKAYEKAINLLGETSDRLTSYGEALLGHANRSQEQGGADARFAKAKAVFEKAAADPRAAKARVYLGLAAEEAGDTAKAREYYNDALKIMPEWGELRERLASLETPQAAGAPQAGQPEIGAPEVNVMVANMAARLEQNGGTSKEWAQLVRSYVVLKQNDKAVAVLAKARKALAANGAELAAFNTAVGAFGLEGGK